MALATGDRKSKLRRPIERDVDRILTRSPVNLANLITVGRLILVVPIIWLIASQHIEAALWLLIAAGLSDAADGYIAKNFNAKSDLGAYLDPLADKALLDGIYIALAIGGSVPVWLAVLVVFRDLAIVVGVVLIQRRHPVFRPTPLLLGKVNTFCQIILAVVALAHAAALLQLGWLIAALTVLVAATTIVSGGAYAVQARRKIAAERSP